MSAEYKLPEKVAVCNLASIALPAVANREGKPYNFKGLHEGTKVPTNNLNKVIKRKAVWEETLVTKVTKYQEEWWEGWEDE
eukprot:8088470-Heterocapsa_arctica.AAC.1